MNVHFLPDPRMTAKHNIALVGVGHMGRSTLAILLRALPQSRFRVIDRDGNNLKQAVALASDRVVGELTDVSLRTPDLSGVDLAVNLAGPFFLGSDAVARAALSAGAAYVDVCDDVEGTRAILSLDEAAQQASVPLLTGGGNSPGVANWMACRLLHRYPQCNGIKIVWIVRESDPGGLAVLRHMLHMAVTPCPIWRDGALTHSPGFVPATAETFSVPEPFGVIEAFDTAHPEPITLSRRFPQLRLIQCKGSLFPQWANAAFSTLGRIGFGHSDLNVEVAGIRIEPAEFLWRLLWARHRSRPVRSGMSCTMINVLGLHDGRARVMYTIADEADMSRGTGIGLAAACLQLLRKGASPGANGVEVLDPEDSLEVFFSLARKADAFARGLIESPLGV